MKYLPRRAQSGFTIVELIVVIVVIAILAVVGAVSYNAVTTDARNKSILADLSSVETAITRYALKNAGKYDSTIEWYSPSGANANLQFTPTNGNRIDVVTNQTHYCIRGFNPQSSHKTIQEAQVKGSDPQACLLLDASVAAGGTGGKIAGWWKLNGNTRDASGNNRDGTAQGSSGTTATPTTGANGQPNGAYMFSSTINQWIQTNYNFPFSRFTVAAWIKPAGASPQSYGGIVSNTRDCCSTYNGFQLHYTNSSSLVSSRIWWGTTSMSSLSASSVTAGTWRHVALTYDGSVSRLYINGVQVSSANLTQNPGASAFNVSIGKGGWSSASYSFGGDIDDVRIYDYALPAADVTRMHSLGAQ